MNNKRNTSELKAKDTALAFTFLFIFIGFIADNELYYKLAAVIAIVSVAWTAPFIWLSRLWFGLAHILGMIVPKIILAAIYYLILTPIAILYRLTHSSSLMLKNSGDTLFKERNHKYSPEDISAPF